MNITHIKFDKEKTIINPVQKEFNRLNEKIEKIRKDIERIPGKIDIIRKFQFEKLAPLTKEREAVWFKTVKKLDEQFDTVKLTNNQRENLANIILEEASIFRMNVNEENENLSEVSSIHQKYTDILYEEDELDDLKSYETEMLKSMSEDLFGLDMDGFEDVPEEEREDFLRQKMEEKMNRDEESKEWKQSRKKRKKKTTAQQQREADQKAETDASLKTLREIYTDLVKKLHPDREKDETIRIEKTELMKQIIEAYEKKDLATLLVMQIKWLQHTDKDPKQQPDDVLKRYNNVLKIHIKKLEEEYNKLLGSPLPFETDFYSLFLLDKNEKALQKYLAEYEQELLMRFDQECGSLYWIQSVSGLKQYIRQKVEEQDMCIDFF
jgi:hypothetical protein